MSARDTSMPVGMQVGFWFAMMLSIALAVAFALPAAGLLPYTIAGHPVSRDAWWRVSPLLLVVSGLAASIAWGIRNRRAWSRHLVMAVWTTIAIGTLASGVRRDLPRAVLVRALVQPALLAALTGWYFYRKRNVVEYFRALERR